MVYSTNVYLEQNRSSHLFAMFIGFSSYKYLPLTMKEGRQPWSVIRGECSF